MPNTAHTQNQKYLVGNYLTQHKLIFSEHTMLGFAAFYPNYLLTVLGYPLSVIGITAHTALKSALINHFDDITTQFSTTHFQQPKN